MATSSGTTYQVFLSFRGRDTRQRFTDVLYHALTDAGIHVFRDDEEIRKGEYIGDEILRAISESRIFVPIFSRGYASGKWCLIELSKMFESMEASPGSNKKILPIFYDVGVDDIKLKTELYAEALLKHREKFSPDEVQQWEEALRKAGKIKGYEVKDMGHGKFIKSFVAEVSMKLKAKHKYVTKYLVQRNDQVEALMKLLDIEASDVRFVGIHGMGGIGKTTLAKTVFNKLCDRYEHCSFLSDVRESCRHNGIEHLQKQLLVNLGYTCGDIVHVDDGIMELTQKLLKKKVLIVLDDVDHRKQIQNLAGDASWFGKGSRVIITTRNQEVLGGEVQTLEADLMKTKEALQLFSKHAFDKDSPPNDYLSLSNEAVESTGRLPLALEVIGSNLRHMPRKKWAKTIKRWKEVPHKDVQEKLMISYEALDRGTKKIFLDISCFFIGYEKTFPMYMWEACGFDAKMGLKVLINMSLVKIIVKRVRCPLGTLKLKRLWMHDLLRDLGRNIAKYNRIWMRADALEVLRDEEGKENVEMLRLCYDNYTITGKEFSGLRKLRYLECPGANFSGNWKLRWLSCRYCPGEFMGTDLSLKKLVILDLSFSFITEDWTGWSQIGEESKLKVLDLTGCDRLRKTPNLSKYSSLIRLILANCWNLVEMDSSISKLKSLEFLNVHGCESLKGFPEELFSLDHLEVILGYDFEKNFDSSKLDFSEKEFVDDDVSAAYAYRQFSNLPESIGNLKSLLTFVLCGAPITELPNSIGGLSRLRCLSLCSCWMLKRLPDSLGDMKSLVQLRLSRTTIVELPQTIGQLVELEILDLSYCQYLKNLTDSIGGLRSLAELDLSLSGITKLPCTIGNLKELKVIKMDFTKIRKLPTTIGKLNGLEELTAIGCRSLAKIPSEIKGCTNLWLLDLEGTGVCILPPNLSKRLTVRPASLQKILWDLCEVENMRSFAETRRDSLQKFLSAREAQLVLE